MTQNQIAFQQHIEQSRHNIAVEQETHRSNVAALEETNRDNVAKLEETKRANLAREANERETNAINALHYQTLDVETQRHNKAVEAETQRANIEQEKLKSEANYWQGVQVTNQGNIAYDTLRETVRSNIAQESINRTNANTNKVSAQGALLRGSAAMQTARSNRIESAARTQQIKTQTKYIPANTAINGLNGVSRIIQSVSSLAGSILRR